MIDQTHYYINICQLIKNFKIKSMKTITELFDFKGKVIIISGAAGAIGSAASRFLSSVGANVVLSDLNEEKVMKLASDIQSETGN